MESGRFAGFSKNAPFDKPDVLRGFSGFSPPFSMTFRTFEEKVCPIRAAVYQNEGSRDPFVYGVLQKIFHLQ